VKSADGVKKRWTMRQKHEMLQKVRGMVIKLAWESWRQLPPQTKVWIQPDDLIEECYLHVLDDILERYDGRAGYTTFLWWSTKNRLLRLAQKQLTQKRLAVTVPLEDADWVGERDDGQNHCEAVDAILWVYEQASPQLRVQMRAWFCPQLKLRLKSTEFQEAAVEFRTLSQTSRLHYEDCLRLMHNGFIMDREARAQGL
jgi:hypothetical protein